jgi:hypothetical protein
MTSTNNPTIGFGTLEMVKHPRTRTHPQLTTKEPTRAHNSTNDDGSDEEVKTDYITVKT